MRVWKDSENYCYTCGKEKSSIKEPQRKDLFWMETMRASGCEIMSSTSWFACVDFIQ